MKPIGVMRFFACLRFIIDPPANRPLQARDGVNPKVHREQIAASVRSAPSFNKFATKILEQKIVQGEPG